MRNWTGFDIRNLGRARDEVTLDAVIADLRDWVDARSTVTSPAGGPTGMRVNVETADDILVVPPDRRDNFFSGLREIMLHQIKYAGLHTKPEDIQRVLREHGMSRPRAWIASRLLPRILRLESGPQIWIDDGKDEIHQTAVFVKQTLPEFVRSMDDAEEQGCAPFA
jgi:hypothetical protein